MAAPLNKKRILILVLLGSVMIASTFFFLEPQAVEQLSQTVSQMVSPWIERLTGDKDKTVAPGGTIPGTTTGTTMPGTVRTGTVPSEMTPPAAQVAPTSPATPVMPKGYTSPSAASKPPRDPFMQPPEAIAVANAATTTAKNGQAAGQTGGTPQLSGIIGGGGNRVAIIRFSGMSRSYRVGESLGAYQILEIGPDSVTLTGPGGSTLLTMGR